MIKMSSEDTPNASVRVVATVSRYYFSISKESTTSEKSFHVKPGSCLRHLVFLTFPDEMKTRPFSHPPFIGAIRAPVVFIYSLGGWEEKKPIAFTPLKGI